MLSWNETNFSTKFLNWVRKFESGWEFQEDSFNKVKLDGVIKSKCHYCTEQNPGTFLGPGQTSMMEFSCEKS